MSNQNARLLLQACIKMRKNMNTLLINGNISQGEYYVMLVLRRQRLPTKASNLSTLMDISRPAVTRILNGLEKKGFITRTISRSDRRVIDISLTETGIDTFQQANSKLLQLSERLVYELGDDDTGKLIELLEKLAGIYEKLNIEGGFYDDLQ